MFLSNAVNFAIESAFLKGSKGPPYTACHLMVNTRGVFRTQSTIYDEASL